MTTKTDGCGSIWLDKPLVRGADQHARQAMPGLKCHQPRGCFASLLQCLAGEKAPLDMIRRLKHLGQGGAGRRIQKRTGLARRPIRKPLVANSPTPSAISNPGRIMRLDRQSASADIPCRRRVPGPAPRSFAGRWLPPQARPSGSPSVAIFRTGTRTGPLRASRGNLPQRERTGVRAGSRSRHIPGLHRPRRTGPTHPWLHLGPNTPG